MYIRGSAHFGRYTPSEDLVIACRKWPENIGASIENVVFPPAEPNRI